MELFGIEYFWLWFILILGIPMLLFGYIPEWINDFKLFIYRQRTWDGICDECGKQGKVRIKGESIRSSKWLCDECSTFKVLCQKCKKRFASESGMKPPYNFLCDYCDRDSIS